MISWAKRPSDLHQTQGLSRVRYEFSYRKLGKENNLALARVSREIESSLIS